MSVVVKRVLCIVGSMNTGGAETFLMKLYRSLDKSKYQMDFCVFSAEKGAYEDEIISMGGLVFHCIPKTANPVKSFFCLKNIVKENKYQYVLRTSQHSLSALELVAAKMGGAKNLVFRSSNSSSCGGRAAELIHKAFKPLVKTIANVKIAPSTEAAEFMFGKNCVKNGNASILKNAVSVELFEYNAETRQRLRKELELEDKFIVGHVGRFQRQKNHKFLVNVFKEILKKKENAHLVLVGGNGELLDETQAYVDELGLKDKVLFLGNRSDVPQLLSVFDVLVFPSLFEGMPNVVIEAQAAGLPCLISDTITKEADITGLVKYFSLNKSAEEWAVTAIEQSEKFERRSYEKEFYDSGYTIGAVTEKFIELIF